MIKDSLATIAEHYGLEKQKLKAIEEMAELTKALLKDDKKNIVEEIADVEIMIVQLKWLLSVHGPVADVKIQKIGRQLKRNQERGGKSMILTCHRCGGKWDKDCVSPITMEGLEFYVCPNCLQDLIDSQEEMTDDEYEADLKAQRADEEYDRRKVEGF